MKVPRILAALTVANSALLVFLLGQMLAPPVAAESGTVLRGSALEIVDGAGRVRASLGILPPSTGADGVAGSETVLFRLINADGQPSVKIGAGATSAGLSFVGGDDASYLILEAKDADSYLKIVEPGGREQRISP